MMFLILEHIENRRVWTRLHAKNPTTWGMIIRPGHDEFIDVTSRPIVSQTNDIVILFLESDHGKNGAAIEFLQRWGPADNTQVSTTSFPCAIWCHYGNDLSLHEVEAKWKKGVNRLTPEIRDVLKKRFISENHPLGGPWPYSWNMGLDWRANFQQLARTLEPAHHKDCVALLVEAEVKALKTWNNQNSLQQVIEATRRLVIMKDLQEKLPNQPFDRNHWDRFINLIESYSLGQNRPHLDQPDLVYAWNEFDAALGYLKFCWEKNKVSAEQAHKWNQALKELFRGFSSKYNDLARQSRETIMRRQ